MAGIFKAYDVRGLYPEQLNEEIAHKVGLVFRAALDESELARNPSVVVSRDMRPHSKPLQDALVDGLLTSGLNVIDIGLATTPTNYLSPATILKSVVSRPVLATSVSSPP